MLWLPCPATCSKTKRKTKNKMIFLEQYSNTVIIAPLRWYLLIFQAQLKQSCSSASRFYINRSFFELLSSLVSLLYSYDFEIGCRRPWCGDRLSRSWLVLFAMFFSHSESCALSIHKYKHLRIILF